MDEGSKGACVHPVGADAYEAQRHVERIRVNELLRFFEPPPQDTDDTTQPWKPRIGTDTSLTAFAQLAALRLNCERSFISLIDDTTQYIIAEATQTISLDSEDIYDGENDKLSFGQTMLDFKTGVCPGTIACFTSLDSSLERSTAYVKANKEYYIMNDMSQLDGYTKRSYVAEWPYMKYYAEVPVHSPAGHTIGTICVVDNKPRDGLDLKGISILKEISSTIMSHLELCESKVQRNRAERQIQALGQFVVGRDSVRELWLEEESSRLPAPGSQHLSLDQRALKEFGSPTQNRKSSCDFGSDIRKLNLDDSNRMASPGSSERGSARLPLHRMGSLQSTATTQSVLSTAEFNSLPTSDTTTNTSSFDSTMLPTRTSSTNEQDKAMNETTAVEDISAPWQDSDSLSTVLARAANLIREAIDLDGVIFQNTSSSQVDPRIAPARIISSSIKQDQINVAFDLHADALQNLTKQFSNGGLLSFDGAGLIRAVPFDTQSLQPRFLTRLENSSFDSIFQDTITAQMCASLNVNELRSMFPNVTQLTIYPLWDIRRDKCVAYCIAWTSNPARIIQKQDVVYLSTFSDSIIAQIARIETVAADQAKTAFISSISHELRSPLHGILASMEILRDLVSDESHGHVLSLVESCGSALLDTVDNVLAYFQTERDSQVDPNAQSSSQLGRVNQPAAAVDLGHLVEDVISICLVGLQFSSSFKGQTKGPHSSTELIVICDVSPGCELITDRAIWKRILMNLLGNALKYTSSGFILVKLEYLQPSIESTDKPTTKRDVCLSVIDSGSGMGKEYMTDHLYKPFRQENSLTPGTGLGLSIVSRLVSSLGGHINISSEVNVGTEATVTATLSTSESVKQEDQVVDMGGLTLGFFDFNAVPDFKDGGGTGLLSSASRAVLLLRSTVSAYASQNNLKTIAAATLSSEEVDILVIEDFRFRDLPLTHFKELKKPVIVLSTRLLPGSDQAASKADNVLYLPRPFGPIMFRRTLLSCHKIRQALAAVSKNQDSLAITEDNPVAVLEPVLIEQPIVSNLAGDDALTRPISSVLLVEDNVINLKLLVKCVSKVFREQETKYAYLTATNGAEAFETYANSTDQISLIFMDIQMPIMDGIEATQKIRQYEIDNSLPRSRIVALTALSSDEAKQNALSCGADLFLTKPVSLKKLTSLLV